MNRRELLIGLAGGACAALGNVSLGAPPPADDYRRANTDWLARCKFGVGFHWTAQTAPRKGAPLPFQQAVDAFALKPFVDSVVQTGADYVLLTAAHALQMLPGPNPVVDRILPGRTCKRDLIGEMADALAEKGIHFLVYYNHSCNGGGDGEWEKAVGYHAPDKRRFADNLCDLIGWMGDHYQRKIKAWWFDSPYSLDPRGPFNSVTTKLDGFQFPWERCTVAAKRGFADRLVTYNPGVDAHFNYTMHQDYWAGEMSNLAAPAKERYVDNGLQWFGWTCLDDPAWVHGQRDAEIPPSRFSDEQLVNYVRACNSHQAPMTFNLGIYQDGAIPPATIEQMHRLHEKLRA